MLVGPGWYWGGGDQKDLYFRTPHSQRQRSAQVRTPRASNTAIRITIDDHVLAREERTFTHSNNYSSSPYDSRTLIHISNSVLAPSSMLGHGRRATSLFDRYQAVRSVITMQTGNLKVYIIHTPNCILIVQTDEHTRGYLINASNFSSYRGQ